jgi:hypothetical protein
MKSNRDRSMTQLHLTRENVIQARSSACSQQTPCLVHGGPERWGSDVVQPAPSSVDITGAGPPAPRHSVSHRAAVRYVAPEGAQLIAAHERGERRQVERVRAPCGGLDAGTKLQIERS